MRRLIVNADDCNLTRGVTEAILKAHRSGIVSSTTFLVTHPANPEDVEALTHAKNLGVGLHLNVTLGRPAAPASEVPSLVDPAGAFRNREDQLRHQPEVGHIEREYTEQIERFTALFARLPTHLDTHHHMHDLPGYFDALCRAAHRFQLPVRRCRFLEGPRRAGQPFTTDFFFGDLDPDGYWRKEKLVECLKNLPGGISEIMCHPGRVDDALRRITSFQDGRGEEYQVFSAKAMRELLQELGIELTHFGLCYT